MTPAPKRFEKVYVEIGNVCNLSCDFCPEPDLKKTQMDRPLFERLIVQISPLADQVCFHLWGEPLIHPLFSSFIGICSSHDLPVNISTNGISLDSPRMDALLSPIVRQVNFSVHSFPANFPGQDPGLYMEKIFSFARRATLERPDLYLNYRLWNLAGPSAAKNEEILRRLELEYDVRIGREVDVRARKGRPLKGRHAAHFDSRFDWPDLDAPIRSDRGTCRGVSRQMGILADGTVVPCCLDKDGMIKLGDAKRSTLEEVLAGERARAMAAGFRRGDLVEDLCRRCTFIARFDAKVPAAGAAR